MTDKILSIKAEALDPSERMIVAIRLASLDDKDGNGAVSVSVGGRWIKVSVHQNGSVKAVNYFIDIGDIVQAVFDSENIYQDIEIEKGE